MKLNTFFFVCVTSVVSCSPYYKTNKSYKKQARLYSKTLRKIPQAFLTNNQPSGTWAGTTNFNLRKPNFVIIHHTAQNSCDETLKTFTLVHSQVSAHYVICKNGIVHHMLNDYLRAWHAGVSRWGSLTDINSTSVGIEIDNNGFENFTEPQINSLLVLLDTLKHKYVIPKANFIGHADVAPTRKNDPNVTFPWKTLASHGFGLWYGDTANLTIPENFDALQSLKIVGYDVRDSSAAKQAFKRHYLQDTTNTWNDADKKILFDLMKKNM